MVRGSWRLAAWYPVLVNTPVPIMLAITIAAVTARPSRRFGAVTRAHSHTRPPGAPPALRDRLEQHLDGAAGAPGGGPQPDPRPDLVRVDHAEQIARALHVGLIDPHDHVPDHPAALRRHGALEPGLVRRPARRDAEDHDALDAL